MITFPNSKTNTNTTFSAWWINHGINAYPVKVALGCPKTSALQESRISETGDEISHDFFVFYVIINSQSLKVILNI